MFVPFKCRRRRGTMLPLLAVCLIGLFGFCGLAIDLGLIAVTRTQSQNAADTAALSACRLLNTKGGSINSNLGPAVAAGKVRVTTNSNLNQNFTNSQIQKIEVGQYLYNPTSETFQVATWYDVTNNQSQTPPTGGAWTAIRVTLKVAQPTYFMRALGVTTMPVGATATAVFRPADVAFVIDMTGSMGNGSIFNLNSKSMNPDNLVPSFGHYKNVPSGNGSGSTVLRATANQSDIPLNNFSIATPGGPPIVRNFFFDPVNIGTPATVAFPLTAAPTKNAFHRWSPPESGGNSDTSTPPTYDFAGYNAFHTGAETTPKGPTPAPGSFGTMTDSTSPNITYVGDRWRRANGSINKTDTTWATGTSSTKAAINAIELLGYNVDTSVTPANVRGGTGSTVITTIDKFRDLVWETHGYDLDIVAYRALKGNGSPLNSFSTLVPTEDRFKGYSMGPGYWGKTFFIWPPDPRPANDWRLKFFTRSGGTAFNTQGDNLSGSGSFDGVNEGLMNNNSDTAASDLTVLATGTSRWAVNYNAVLAWIKSGPQVLPPNLRAGHVLYYSSIPNDVDTNSGSTQERLDKIWWKKYIDYVLAYNNTNAGRLYGKADNWSLTGAGKSLYTGDMNLWRGPGNAWGAAGSAGDRRPYMAYNDSPFRPRLHFWFGPLSMIDFMKSVKNWLPGTSNEAQCWQLKAGMNSVLTDVKNNHPNHYVGLTMFSTEHNNVRRPMGQKFDSLKNALFYPRSLLDTIDLANGGTSVTCEYRPYDTGFSAVDGDGSGLNGDEIPSAAGGTDAVTGMAYGFNLLSPSTLLPAQYTTKARRGAAKMVIFETDGVPNRTRTCTPNPQGYNTYYPIAGGASTVSTSAGASAAVTVVKQMAKQMATGLSGDSGLSLPNAPCRVFPIAFGDLFDTALVPASDQDQKDALKFLAEVAEFGNTGPSGAITIPTSQIITGPFQTRIDTLKTGLEKIFQSGVGVALVE